MSVPARAPLPRLTRALLLGVALAGVALVVFGFGWRDAAPTWAKSVMLIGAVTAIAAGAAAFLGPENRLLVLLCGALGGVALFVANAYLIYERTLPSPMDVKAEAAHAADPNWDDRKLLEVVRDLRGDGLDAVPYLIGRFAIDDNLDPPLLPLSGISTATTVICNEVGRYAVYPADDHGFNNPRPWPEHVDVVVIGDSYAHGACVSPSESVAAQLRTYGHTVVSLGVSGYGPMLTLATLMEFGLALKPKAVVWVWSDNDYTDLVYEMTSPKLRRYLDEPDYRQDLVNRQPEVDAFWRTYLEDNKLLEPESLAKKDSNPGSDWRGYIDDGLKLRTLRDRLGLGRNDDFDATIKQIVRVITAAVSRTRAGGGTLYFIDLPHWYEATVPVADRKPDFVTYVGELDGLEIVDFSTALYDTGDPHAYFPYRLPAHFNAQGYALLAKTIDAAIRN